jgi:hypothetical protein
VDADRDRAQSLKPSRTGVLAAGCAVAAAAVAAFGWGALPGEMRDFEVYWTAASRALRSEPLYRTADGHYQFKYLPAFAVLAAPVAIVSLAVAKSAWFVVSVAALTALIALSVALLPEQRRPTGVLVLVLFVAMGKFYGHELVLGQVNLLFAVLAALGILLMRRGRHAAAAALFVGAMVVKPYGVLLLPWLAVRGGRPAVLTTIGAVAAILLLPVLFYGVATIDLHRAWWITVTESTAPNLTNADNVSLAGFFAKWLGPGTTAAAATVAVGAALVAGLAVMVLRRETLSGREVLEGAVLLTVIPLLSPQGWDYVFLVATPAIALLVNYDRDLPAALRLMSWVSVLTIGLSVFDLMGREHYAAFMAWSVITVCFLVILIALAALRLRRAA